MSDRPTITERLDQARAQVDALMHLLSLRARHDHDGALLPGQDYEPRVGGTTGDTTTEKGLERLGRAATYNKVAHTFEETVEKLSRVHDDITPSGKTCRSAARDMKTGRLVTCERLAVTRGFCAKCWPHVRQGHPPDATLIADWNSRLDRDCECEAPVCPHPPGACLNRITAGVQARTCGTCRNRRSQHTEGQP